MLKTLRRYYQVDGSSSNIDNALTCFKRFGYAPSGRGVAPMDYDATFIYNKLLNRIPTYVRGHSYTTGGYAGHAWVVDGYIQSEKSGVWSLDFFHCNYGWAGWCDGFYVPGVFDHRGGAESLGPDDVSGSRDYYWAYGLKMYSPYRP